MEARTFGEILYAMRENKKIAVICGDEEITYRDLWNDGVRIAWGLIKAGVQKGDRVAVDTGRTSEYARMMAGIAICGAIGVNVDRTQQKQHTERILEDSSPRLIVDDAGAKMLRESIDNDIQISAEELVRSVKGEDPYWLIYSSGSTGTPKGSVLCHRTVLVTCRACAQNVRTQYMADHCDRILVDGALSFLAAVFFFLYALCNKKTAVFANEQEFCSLTDLARCIKRNRVDFICRPQSWLVKAVENPDYADAIGTVRMFSLGGEKNTDDAVRILREHAPDATVFLSYGSSELIVVSDFEWAPGKTDLLGQPIRGIKVFLLDDKGKPVKAGMTGEICVGGETAALGCYWNAPELTAEKYEMHPAYGRICHTGDMGRIEADGQIHILGRKDNMIKIHGVRIEPEYLEKVLRGFPDIREAAVVLKDMRVKALCAFYACEDADLDERELRRYLADELPYYMIPSYLIKLDQMPLNNSGKLDRKALTEMPVKKKRRLKEGENDVHSELEELLCRIFSRVLNLSGEQMVRSDDNFFEMGGDSLAVFEALYLLEQEGYTLDMKMLYAAPTPALLAEFVLPAEKTQEQEEVTCKDPQNRELSDKIALEREKMRHAAEKELGRKVAAVYPVTYSMAQVLQRDSSWMMCIPFSMDMGPGRKEWESCIKETAKTHEALRTVFLEYEGDYMRAVLEENDPTCFYVDLSGQAVEGTLVSSRQRKYFETVERLFYDKKTPPLGDVLFQAGLIRVSRERSILLFYVSHLLLDEAGAANLARDILSSAGGKGSGISDSSLFEKRVRRVFCGDRVRAMRYWDFICRPDRREIVELRMAPEKKDTPSIRLGIKGGDTARNRAAAFCRSQGVSFAVFIHALIGRTLGRLAGKETVSFLTVCASRNKEEIRLAGLFAQSVPFRYSMKDTWLDIQEQLIVSQTHAWLMDAPDYYEGIAKRYEDSILLNIKDDYHERRMKGCVLLEQNQIVSTEEIAAQLNSRVEAPPHGRIRIYVNRNWPHLYMIDFFTGEVTVDFARHLKEAVETELAIMTDAGAQAGEAVIKTAPTGTMTGSIRDILLKSVEKRRDKTLFVFPESGHTAEITANQFKTQVFALGTWLYDKGYRDRRIAIVGSNSQEWVLMVYTILCGENTAVLIDPELVPEEIEARALQAGADIVTGEDELLKALDKRFEKLPFSQLRDKIHEGEKLIKEKGSEYEENAPDPEREAVIMFTTGTTGASKALALTHRNLFCSMDGMARTILNRKDDITMMITLPLHHIGALSGMLFLYTWVCAKIVIVREYRMLLSAIKETKPGYTTIVPRLADVILTWLKGLQAKGDRVDNPLKEIALVGTTVSPVYREEFAQFGTNVIDCYGMTETSGAIFMCGTPINGVDVTIKGEKNRGEIMVRGPVVFDGYMDDEESNHKVFEDGWFHTGDIGTLGKDGLYTVTGRLKNLIILSNGENISPEEIESHLDSSPLIRESLVYEEEDRLTAALVAETGEEVPDEKTLEEEWLPRIQKEVKRIQERLPVYKHVTRIVLRQQALQRNALGKLIRRGDIQDDGS